MMMPKSKLIRSFAFIVLSLFILQLTGCTKTSLIAAARYGDVSTTYKLLKEGAKVDEPNEAVWNATPLFWSLYECKFETAKILLAKEPRQPRKIPTVILRCKWHLPARMQRLPSSRISFKKEQMSITRVKRTVIQVYIMHACQARLML